MVNMSTLRDQLARIKQRIAPKIDDALEHEVADAIRDEEAETIKETIYGVRTPVYSPKMYHRRGDDGGMGDPYNIEHEVKDGVLTVVNKTDPNPGGTMNNDLVTTGKYLDKLIEYGHGSSGGFYDFPKAGANFMKPRPFTAKTIEHLKQNKAHVDALQDGLERQGIKTKKG